MLRPLLFQLPAESAHRAGFAALRLLEDLLERFGGGTAEADPVLAQDLWGLHFPGPLGLAAGFDKNAELPHVWAALGFGFAELGTITAHPQPGNPRPRLFRLPADRALINRLGFNNRGAAAVAGALAGRLQPPAAADSPRNQPRQIARHAARCGGRRLSAELSRPRPAGGLRRDQRQLPQHARTARPAVGGPARAATGGAAEGEPRAGAPRATRAAPASGQGGARPRRRGAERRRRGGHCGRMSPVSSPPTPPSNARHCSRRGTWWRRRAA